MACTPGILKILYPPMYSIHPCIVPPGTGQNPRNLQDTRGTVARDIRYMQMDEWMMYKIVIEFYLSIDNLLILFHD